MHALQDGYLTEYGCKQVTSKKYTITGGLAVKRLKAGLVHAKIRFGPRTGWLPCVQSVGKSSLWLIGSFSPETSAPGSPGLVWYNMQGSTSTIIPQKKTSAISPFLCYNHYLSPKRHPPFSLGVFTLVGYQACQFFLHSHTEPIIEASKAHDRFRVICLGRRGRGRRGLQDLGFAPFAVWDPRFGCWPVRLMRFWVHGDIAAFWNENANWPLLVNSWG